jgi:phosphatidylserine decarboxylase
MKTPPSVLDLPPPELPTSVQPGGFGLFVRLELLWGRVRRAFLRRLRPGHVRFWLARRRGRCDRFTDDVIDPRDLKFIRNVCGYSFDPDDDVYRRRESLGFARYGYAELVGFSVILGALAAAASVLAVTVSAWFLVLSSVAVFLWLEVLWFFRDPERLPPDDPSAVLSPADGTVSHVETVDEPGMGPDTLRISIFLSIFNVHGNRAPRAGTVEQVVYFRGRFLDARHADCAKQNEQLWADFRDQATGLPFRVKQISGAIARRIVCRLKPGDEMAAGDRYGMIKFGSRTDLLIPGGRVKETLVKVGDRVRGGVTILARCK